MVCCGNEEVPEGRDGVMNVCFVRAVERREVGLFGSNPRSRVGDLFNCLTCGGDLGKVGSGDLPHIGHSRGHRGSVRSVGAGEVCKFCHAIGCFIHPIAGVL